MSLLFVSVLCAVDVKFGWKRYGICDGMTREILGEDISDNFYN